MVSTGVRLQTVNCGGPRPLPGLSGASEVPGQAHERGSRSNKISNRRSFFEIAADERGGPGEPGNTLAGFESPPPSKPSELSPDSSPEPGNTVAGFRCSLTLGAPGTGRLQRSPELTRLCSRKVARVVVRERARTIDCHEKKNTIYLDIVAGMVDVITRHDGERRWVMARAKS